MGPVTDPRDVRVLIPRVRRAIDGPQATGSGSVAASLTDEEMTGLIADAIAEIILYAGSLFESTLEAVERDPYYMAPTAWQVDPPMNDNEEMVIVAQAAINYFFERLRDLKTSEEIADEGQKWTYSISANLVRDQLRLLSERRDKALEALRGAGMAMLDTYVSFVAERDRLTAMYVEPWVAEIGAPVPYTDPGRSLDSGHSSDHYTW